MYNIIKLSVHHDGVCCSCSDPVILHPNYRHRVLISAPKRHDDNNISCQFCCNPNCPLRVQNNRCIPTIRAGDRPTGATIAERVQQGSHRISEGGFYIVPIHSNKIKKNFNIEILTSRQILSVRIFLLIIFFTNTYPLRVLYI